MDGSAKVVAFLATKEPEAALRFYQDTLGLRLAEDAPFALVFDGGGVTLRIAKVAEVVVAPYTVLGWDVADVRAAVQQLSGAGITFKRFDGLTQDDVGIWVTPDGYQVAWFNDPDGHMLSVSQAP